MRRAVRLRSAAALGLALLCSVPVGAQVHLWGSGSTFVSPMLAKWFDAYAQVDPSVRFEYTAVGSGKGIEEIMAQAVDFGASDGPMTDQQLKAAPGAIAHFPTVLGADVFAYNLGGVSGPSLKITPEVIADIFLGRITKWNDPALVATNPDIALPSNDIVVVHRITGSGTTYIWTDYLSKVSPEWRDKVGRGTVVTWPVGLGGVGNEGVAGLVKRTPFSVGYVGLIYAVSDILPVAEVRNRAGNFVKPSTESVTAAAAGVAETMPDDFRVSITDPPGADAYPIASLTWMLVYEKQKDAAKGTKLAQFIDWMIHDGQRYAPGLHYAPLPEEMVGKEELALQQLTMLDGKPLLQK